MEIRTKLNLPDAAEGFYRSTRFERPLAYDTAADGRGALGYAYVYSKTIRLTPAKPEMVISHRLINTGRLPIRTNVYNHNFLVLDRLPPGPDYSITVPYALKTTRPPDAQFAEIRGNRIAYVKNLENQERMAFPLLGFGAEAMDCDFRIENAKAGWNADHRRSTFEQRGTVVDP